MADNNFITDIPLCITMIRNIIDDQKNRNTQGKELGHYLFIFDDCINEFSMI